LIDMSTYDKDKIRQAISSMTAICDKGKAEVTKLVESIIGQSIAPPPKQTMRIHHGHFYKCPGSKEFGTPDGYRLLVKSAGGWNIFDVHDWCRVYPDQEDENEVRQFMDRNSYIHIGRPEINWKEILV
jgi:hypothetical protein